MNTVQFRTSCFLPDMQLPPAVGRQYFHKRLSVQRGVGRHHPWDRSHGTIPPPVWTSDLGTYPHPADIRLGDYSLLPGHQTWGPSPHYPTDTWW